MRKENPGLHQTYSCIFLMGSNGKIRIITQELLSLKTQEGLFFKSFNPVVNVVCKDQSGLLTNAQVGRLERYCAFDETRRIESFKLLLKVHSINSRSSKW